MIKIIFFGTPDFVVPVLEELSKNFTVVGIVTTSDKKVGRKQILTPSPIKLASQGVGLEARIFSPEKLDDTLAQQLKTLNPDLFAVISYGKIIPPSLLEIPKFGVLNIHYSILPKYRGATPMQTAILNGDKVSGITILKMDERLDHGPILLTKEFILSNQATFASLSIDMTRSAIPLLIGVIPDFIEGKVNLKEQDHSKATFTHIIKKEDGYFEINNPPSPDKLDRMVRAYYPWPNAWTLWKNKVVKFLPNSLVQIEGKNPTKLEDFLRGYPDFPLKFI